MSRAGGREAPPFSRSSCSAWSHAHHVVLFFSMYKIQNPEADIKVEVGLFSVFLCFVFFFFSFPFFSLVYIRFYVHFSFLLRLSFIFQRRVFSLFLSRVKILDIRRFVCFRSNVIFLHIYLCYLVSVIVMKTHFLFLAFFLNHRYMTNIRNVNWQLICNTNNDIRFSIYTSNCLANTEII